MCLKYIVLLLMIGWLASAAYGQTIPDYRFKTLSFTEGLSHADVTSIAQDSLGYVWLATENGLNRYDGTEITVFKRVFGDTTSLPDNNVTQLFIDRRHRMWVVTSSGICRYHPEDNRFESYRLDTITNAPHHTPLDLVEDARGQLFVLSNYNTVLKFSETRNSFEKYFTINSDKVTRAICVYQDRWFAASPQHLLEVNPRTGEVIRSTSLGGADDAPPLLSSGISQIVPIGNQLWLVGSDIYLHRFSLTTQTLTSIHRVPYATSLASLSDSTFLVGSRKGIFLYYPRQNCVLPIRSVDDRVIFKNVFTVFVDKNQNLWASIRSQGVVHTAGERVFRDARHLNPEMVLLTAEVSTMEVVGEELWMGLNIGQVMSMNLRDRSYRLLTPEARGPQRPGRGYRL